jgi:hypothetical protein
MPRRSSQSPDPRTGVCALCEHTLRWTNWHEHRHCFQSAAVRPEGCWALREGSGLALCAQSLAARRTTAERFEVRLTVLRGLGKVIDGGDAAVMRYLRTLTPEQTYELVRSAVPALQARVSALLKQAEVQEPRRERRQVSIPESLPEQMREVLVKYQAKLERRSDRLTEKGHTRSYTYAARLMSEPLRLSLYLVAEGHTSWLSMKRRDVVSFMAKNPAVLRTSVERFLRFLEEDRPFAAAANVQRKGAKRKSGVGQSSPAHEVLSPEELKAILDRVRSENTEPEYLLTWLICKMGLTAQAAYDITLDKFEVNEAGRLAIRPARVWVLVPKSVATIFERNIELLFPGWRDATPEERSHMSLFTTTVPKVHTFVEQTLGQKARTLRASAIYAAMRAGHLDRVTLVETMGVSIATIQKLERLLSTDLHRTLPAAFVKERNKHIMGTAGTQDDGGTE